MHTAIGRPSLTAHYARALQSSCAMEPHASDLFNTSSIMRPGWLRPPTDTPLAPPPPSPNDGALCTRPDSIGRPIPRYQTTRRPYSSPLTSSKTSCNTFSGAGELPALPPPSTMTSREAAYAPERFMPQRKSAFCGPLEPVLPANAFRSAQGAYIARYDSQPRGRHGGGWKHLVEGIAPSGVHELHVERPPANEFEEAAREMWAREQLEREPERAARDEQCVAAMETAAQESRWAPLFARYPLLVRGTRSPHRYYYLRRELGAQSRSPPFEHWPDCGMRRPEFTFTPSGAGAY